VIGRADLAESPLLAAAAGRREHEAQLDDAVAAWTATRPIETAVAELVAAGVPAHVSAASADFCTDPQLEHRGYLIRLPHAEFGSVVVEGPRYLLSETPGRVERAAPMFGEDNDAVLIGRLGLSADRVTQLTAEGVLR
jgi:crotonobetainyl-CoA:carnitine CoA-transferase CaiB-like acyl-CoA transferase